MLGFAPFPTAAFNDVASTTDPQNVSGQLFPQGFWLNIRGPYSGYEHGDAFTPFFMTTQSDHIIGNSGKDAIASTCTGASGSPTPPYNNVCNTAAGGSATLTPNPEYNAQNSSGNKGYNFEFKLPPNMNHSVLLKMLDPLDECSFDTSDPAIDGGPTKPSGYTGPTPYDVYQDWNVSSGVFGNGNNSYYPDVSALISGNNGTSGAPNLVSQGNGSLDNCDVMYWKDSAGNSHYDPLTLKITIYQPSTRAADNNAAVPANTTLTVASNTVSVGTGVNPIYGGAEWQQIKNAGSCTSKTQVCKTHGAHAFQWLTLASAINTLPTAAYVRVSVEAVQNSAYYASATGSSYVGNYGTDYSGSYGVGDKQFAMAVCDITSGLTETSVFNTQTYSESDPGAYGDIFNATDWETADPTGVRWDQGCPDPNLDTTISSSLDSTNRFEVNGREAISLVTASLVPSSGQLGDFIPLAEIPPRFAGSTVTIRLFDAGDVGGNLNNFISILGPGDNPNDTNFTAGNFVGNYTMSSGQSFKSDPYQLSISSPSVANYSPAGQGRPPFWCGAAYSGAGTDYNANNPPLGSAALCPPSSQALANQGVQVSDSTLSPQNIFANGTWLEFHVKIPAAGTYVGTPGKDWWKVLYNLKGNAGTRANDTTTWEINSGAAPVHLLTGQ
jgi:hypothetical protein